MPASRFAVDASVVAKWYFTEPLSAEADRLAESDAVLLAPDLLLAELAHVVRRRVLRNEVSAELGEAILSSAAMRLRFQPLRSQLPAAFRLSLRANIDLYDAIYVALAADAGTPLVTADEKLVRALRAHKLGRHVRFLGEPEFVVPNAL